MLGYSVKINTRDFCSYRILLSTITMSLNFKSDLNFNWCQVPMD